ncbi:hypothetical protein FHY30_000760 [Xanthomonas arboricola]|uniref:hypothetical protein n=1 Tax=Xanthomonas campestris TaxID=339 RepID=UPI000CDB37C9|nr:hypothetical protein [Xanthomonas campestris]MCW2002067.1 hypothetical protein [Xanthomonas campestris]TXD43047.1 hypothetical protein TR80_009295 [Xanthomonas campestris]
MIDTVAIYVLRALGWLNQTRSTSQERTRARPAGMARLGGTHLAFPAPNIFTSNTSSAAQTRLPATAQGMQPQAAAEDRGKPA